MKKPILPEHVKMKMAAVKWTPSRLDPASKKLYNKWNREHKKWEKAEEKRAVEQAVEQAAKAERDKIARIERHWYEDITSQIEENDNTINWNVERQCKFKDKNCNEGEGCSSMRVVLTPKLHKKCGLRGKFVCNCCDRMDKWINESELQEALWDL